MRESTKSKETFFWILWRETYKLLKKSFLFSYISIRFSCVPFGHFQCCHLTKSEFNKNVKHSRKPANWTKNETIIKMRNILSQFPFGSNVAFTNSILKIVVVVDFIIVYLCYFLFWWWFSFAFRFTSLFYIMIIVVLWTMNSSKVYDVWMCDWRLWKRIYTYIGYNIQWTPDFPVMENLMMTQGTGKWEHDWNCTNTTIVTIFRRFFNIPIRYVEHWMMKGSVWLFVAWNSVMYFSSFFFFLFLCRFPFVYFLASNTNIFNSNLYQFDQKFWSHRWYCIYCIYVECLCSSKPKNDVIIMERQKERKYSKYKKNKQRQTLSNRTSNKCAKISSIDTRQHIHSSLNTYTHIHTHDKWGIRKKKQIKNHKWWQ